MRDPARLATTALAVIAIVLITALLAHAAVTPAPEQPCAAAAEGVYLGTARTVADRLRAEESRGPSVSRAAETIASDAVLAQAVARGDLARTRSEIIALLYNHQHIVRIRVLRGGRPFADIGGALVLSPSFGALRAGGRRVGTFEFSIQDDMGYRLLAERLLGIYTVMRFRGETVMENVAVGSRALPDGGRVEVGGRSFLIATITAGRFPAGRLTISLLVPRPEPGLGAQSCAQVRADALAAIAQHIYEEYRDGPLSDAARSRVARSHALRAAVEAQDPLAAQRVVVALRTRTRLARLEVRVGSRLLAGAGYVGPLIAPVRVELHNRAGHLIGQALLAAQNAHGYVNLASYLTDSPIVVRAGTRQIAGMPTAPESLPVRGAISVGADGFHVASFPAIRFPSGALTISLLSRD